MGRHRQAARLALACLTADGAFVERASGNVSDAVPSPGGAACKEPPRPFLSELEGRLPEVEQGGNACLPRGVQYDSLY